MKTGKRKLIYIDDSFTKSNIRAKPVGLVHHKKIGMLLVW